VYDIKGWDPIFQFQLTDHVIENDKLNLWLLITRQFPDDGRIEDKNHLMNYRTSIYMHYKVIQPVLLTLLNYKKMCYSIAMSFHSSFLKPTKESFSFIGGLSQYGYNINRYWVQVISLLKQYYSVQISKISRIGLYKMTKRSDLERFVTIRGVNYYNNRIVVKDPDFKPYENADIYHSKNNIMKYYIMSIADNHIDQAQFRPNNYGKLSSTNFFYSKLEKNFSYKNTNHIKFMNTENTCYKNDDDSTKNTLPYSIRLKNFNDMLYYCIVTFNYDEIIDGYKNKTMNTYDRNIIDKVRNREMITNIEFLNPNSSQNKVGIGDDLVESVFDIIGWSGNLIDKDDDAYYTQKNPYRDSILYFESYSDNPFVPKRSSVRFTYKYQC